MTPRLAPETTASHLESEFRFSGVPSTSPPRRPRSHEAETECQQGRVSAGGTCLRAPVSGQQNSVPRNSGPHFLCWLSAGVFSAPGHCLHHSIIMACKGMRAFNARTSVSSTRWRKLSAGKAFMCIALVHLDNLPFVIEIAIITGMVSQPKCEGGVTRGLLRILPSTGACQHIQTLSSLSHPISVSCMGVLPIHKA